MNCLTHIVKYILYIFNLIFVICGILLIVLGSLMINNIGDFSSSEDYDNLKTIPILIIILGCIVFVIAFFGCCGSIQEKTCCITIYSVFMFILLGLQVALVVWIFVKRAEFLNLMGQTVDEAFQKYDESNGNSMDAIQINLDCCGRISYKDYIDAGKSVPKSCCGLSAGECTASVYASKPGCRAKFIDFWDINMDIIRYAGIGVALVELVAFIFAACLISNIRNSRHRM